MVSTPISWQESYRNRPVHFKHSIRLKNFLPPSKTKFSDVGGQNISPFWIHQPVADVKPSDNYQSMMWNYLNKLKNLFFNPFFQAAVRENSPSKMDKLYNKHYLKGSHQRTSFLVSPSKYTVSNLRRPRKAELQGKVYSATCTAIEDGFVNKALKRKRNYFISKSVHPRIFHRAATDRLSRYCRRCCMMGASKAGVSSLLKMKSKKLPKQGKRRPTRIRKLIA